MIRPGDVVGSYRVIEPVGKGGTGVVYLAEHVALGRRVALKVLRGDVADDEDAASRFFTEARLVNRIGHQHIVDITDFGSTASGQCFYAMELLIGETLGARLRLGGPFSLKRTLHVAVQIAGALAASHDVGIIHRDLKPENIFLIDRMGDEDFVKVLDFGLAKLLGIAAAGMPNTLQGTIQGTPHYMSPEQSLGRKDVDHRTDIYALGVILFQMVTGELPFTADGWGEVMLMHSTQPFPSVRLRRPQLPARFETLLQKAVAKDRDDRFFTMLELRDALLSLLDSSYLPDSTPLPVLASGAGGPAVPGLDSGQSDPERLDSGRLDSGRLVDDAVTDVKLLGMPTLRAEEAAPSTPVVAARALSSAVSPGRPLAAPRQLPDEPHDDSPVPTQLLRTGSRPSRSLLVGAAAAAIVLLGLGFRLLLDRPPATGPRGASRPVLDGGAAAATAPRGRERVPADGGGRPFGTGPDAAAVDLPSLAGERPQVPEVAPPLGPAPAVSAVSAVPPGAGADAAGADGGLEAPAAPPQGGRGGRARGTSRGKGGPSRGVRPQPSGSRALRPVPRAPATKAPATKYDVMDPD